jgi:hypothetical protein
MGCPNRNFSQPEVTLTHPSFEKMLFPFLVLYRISLKNDNCFKDPTFIKQKTIAQLKLIL